MFFLSGAEETCCPAQAKQMQSGKERQAGKVMQVRRLAEVCMADMLHVRWEGPYRADTTLCVKV
jgi:hypothetical protein